MRAAVFQGDRLACLCAVHHHAAVEQAPGQQVPADFIVKGGDIPLVVDERGFAVGHRFAGLAGMGDEVAGWQ
ncbi:hypothetical protein D3C80_2123430 [compost metagenome]